MDPTDRSIPPATMTGVSATARRPSSTLNLVISKKFPRVKKPGATAEKKRISPARTTSSTHSPFGNHRCRHDIAPGARLRNGSRRAGGAGLSGAFSRFSGTLLGLGSRPRGGEAAVCTMADPLCGDGDQDDPALDRTVPVGAHTEKRERRTDGRKQDDTEPRA